MGGFIDWFLLFPKQKFNQKQARPDRAGGRGLQSWHFSFVHSNHSQDSPPQPVSSHCAETPGLFTSPFWLSHLQQFVINVRSRPGGYNYVVVGILLLGGSLELVEGKQWQSKLKSCITEKNQLVKHCITLKEDCYLRCKSFNSNNRFDCSQV